MGNLFCGDAETYTLDAPETLVEMARKEGFVMSDDVVSSELAKDPDKVDMTDEQTRGRTPLMWASHVGSLANVQFLVKQKADVNKKGGKHGNTPLIIAAYQGHSEIVKALLDSGAKLDIRDADHMTALEEAKKQSSREAISLLIAKEKKYDLTGLLPKIRLASKFIKESPVMMTYNTTSKDAAPDFVDRYVKFMQQTFTEDFKAVINEEGKGTTTVNKDDFIASTKSCVEACPRFKFISKSEDFAWVLNEDGSITTVVVVSGRHTGYLKNGKDGALVGNDFQGKTTEQEAQEAAAAAAKARTDAEAAKNQAKKRRQQS